LLSAIPVADPRRTRVRDLGLTEGEASLLEAPSGCSFHERCASRLPRCAGERPALVGIAADHRAACFLHSPTVAVGEDTP
jgi:oligopeptide/dipeptide ABC transporter ATP-binding protein